MLKNKILEKLLAIILIFTLTFTNFAFVSKAYASTFVDVLFGEKSETGHENIGFEAYFGTEESMESSVISDVNNEELAISMKLNVLENGYLKDAKIAIVEAEEGDGLNFKLKEKEELDLYVQGIEENIISLQQINSQEEDINFVLPIKYQNEAYVAEEKLSKDFLVAFSGVYVDNDGEEIPVSKDVRLNLSWKDSREVRVETQVEKYIDFGEGVILQTLVKVDNATENNSLPVKESEVTIVAPVIEGMNPSNVYVVANSTAGTNGKNVGEVVFTDENWEYNQEENKVNIKITNDKELVKVDEYEDEYLHDAEKEIIEEERFFNGSGVDEYLITYTFMGAEVLEEEITTNSEIEAKQTTFSGVETEEKMNVVTNKNNYENLLNGKIGDIVSLNIENETEEVSKAYTYVNYNNNDKYEVEFKTETIVNVSYTEIVESLNVVDVENLYVDKEGNTQENIDIYYKQVSLSKENFTSILGEGGEIKILDISGNVLNTINKDSETTEDGNIVINFNEKYSKLSFETTKPVGEGNLVINNVKAMSNSSLEKTAFANIAEVKTKSTLKADYEYVEELIEIGTSEITTKLADTQTKATLVMDRDSLSTLEKNKNVELRIELNNAVETSDVYGNSVFEIEIPESIESFEITNTSLLYAEGLEVVSSEVVDRKIVVTISGSQDGINSGVLTNGTNIVINANIKVNLFTPAKTEKLVLKYTNSEATNYENEGVAELEVAYSAPTGIVTVNSISGYDQAGSSVTSVRQGEKEDLLDIYSDSKIATMELIVMNNNENTVSNFAILGRTPFEGVKDIISGDELGTTTTAKLLTTLTADERNQSQFKIYYSENGEATKDLEDANNGWNENPENLENIKSYLIVPQEENYEMKETEILRFTYQYEIPANLPHNEDFYGTFVAYYTNNSELAVMDEQSAPDKVGLTTGEGPELNLTVSGNRDSVREHEELTVTLLVSNVGENKAENIDVSFDIPENTTYISSECARENVTINKEENKLKIFATNLEKDEEFEVKVTLEVEKISSSKANQIKPVATIAAKDLGTVLTSEGSEIKIIEAEFEVTQYNKLDLETTPDVYEAGDELAFRIYAKNLTENTMNNVVITEVLPEELIFVSATIRGYEADGRTSKDIGEGTFDEATRTVTWNVSEIKRLANAQLMLNVKANNIDESLTIKSVDTVVKVKADGTDTYESNPITTRIGRPVLVVNQTTENPDTYIKEGQKINYVFTVRNEGKATAEHVKLTEVIPEGIIIEKINYSIDGVMATKRINSKKQAEITSNIDAGEELIVNVTAVAASLDGVQEKTVTNYATVSAVNVPEIQSNGITHIIEMSEKNAQSFDISSSTSVTTSDTLKSNITKTYKISGTAWLDSNENGTRETDEKIMSGISAKLVNSETGLIIKAVTTDSTGAYTFTGVENGNYLVIFDYDTVKYTVTAYRKDGVGEHVNSDVVTTKLEQDGRTRNGAITDVITISNGSVSGIDIGFVLADTFDLALEKTITKLTVQSVKGTTTNTYENVNLAKTEIAAKYMSGSTVYVEYEMKVTNKGDVAGYAKKIVDYLPEGMTFNSSLEANASWYTGTDGNIYSTALAENELAPGESATIKLVLTKQMTEENVGIVNNLAEIYDDYNIYGISDTNSTPANKAQGENDLGTADAVISVKTGEVFIHISVIITSMLIGSIMVFAIYIQIVSKRRKGGV